MKTLVLVEHEGGQLKDATLSAVTSHWPFGLFRSLAILAINLLGPIPAEAVSFVF